MPDENGTESTRSDAPGADGSPFGDAPDDTASPAAEEEESKDRAEQHNQGSDDAESQTDAPEDLKVVVSIRGGMATIGVQRPSCDPHIETFDDREISGLAQDILAVVEGREPGGRRLRSTPVILGPLHRPVAGTGAGERRRGTRVPGRRRQRRSSRRCGYSRGPIP